MIEFHDVGKCWTASDGQVPALDAVTLAVPTGTTLCVIGESGSGKSTLLRCVNRMVTPTGGHVEIDGHRVAHLDPHALRRRIGYVIQSGALFPHLDVAGNVGLMMRLSGHAAKDIALRVDTLLRDVGLDPSMFRDRPPRALSGGEAQRVGIARALALDPEVLLFDEPFSALDPLTRAALHETLRELQASRPRTLILVTHDMHEALALGDAVVVLRHGRVEQHASARDVVNQPATPYVTALVNTARGAWDHE